MKFGVCVGGKELNRIAVAAKLGFDYIESNFGFIARATDEEFEELKATLIENNIPCEAANCFMPNDLPVTGPAVNYEAIKEYVEKGMNRANQLGIKIVVFGSGGARRFPEGFSYAEAFRQLGYFLREIVSPIAEKYGITVVVEPLRAQECNIINTVNEGTMLSVLSGKDNIKTLADIYHMCFAHETADNIKLVKGSLYHAHISHPLLDIPKRVYMRTDDTFDYKPFIEALKYVGCERCSIEAASTDFDNDAVEAMKVIKSF